MAAEAHRSQLRSQRRELHQPPARRRPHRRRHRPRRDLGRRRAAARRRRGHRDHARRRRGGLRRRGRRDRRRRHQARAHPVRLARGPAGGDDAQDARGDGPRPAGARHQARRPAAQHAHASPAMPPEKQQRIAQETLDIYAPLAHRLGHAGAQAAARGPLASPRCTRSASPSSTTSSAAARPSARCTSPQAIAEVRGRLAELGIDAEVTGRGKHLWSIYEKMVVKGREFDDIFDLVAMRVIVDSMKDCYAALGLHPRALAAGGGSLQGLHRDAKFNLYQSLHTTVIGPRRQADRGADPHPRDAPAGRVGRRRPLGVQGRRRRPATSTGSTGSSTGRPRSATRRSSWRA